jgi:hypothetical protein
LAYRFLGATEAGVSTKALSPAAFVVYVVLGWGRSSRASGPVLLATLRCSNDQLPKTSNARAHSSRRRLLRHCGCSAKFRRVIMLKRLLIATLFLAGCATTAAHAQSFSFTSTGTPSNGIGVQVPDGPMLTSGTLSGSGATSYNGGRGVAFTFTCNAWSTPGMDTDTRGLCNVAEGATDRYAMSYVCSIVDPATQGSFCWGLLVGQAGRFAGKTGTITFQGTPAGSTGQGAWRD